MVCLNNCSYVLLPMIQDHLVAPCQRWNEIIHNHLRRLNAKYNWHQKAQDRVAWWQEVEDAAQIINSKHETQEKETKYKNKQKKEELSAEDTDALVCPD